MRTISNKEDATCDFPNARLMIRKNRHTRRASSPAIVGNLGVYRAEFATLPILQIPRNNSYASVTALQNFKSTATRIAMITAGLFFVSAIFANTWVSPSSNNNQPLSSIKKISPSYAGDSYAKNPRTDIAPIFVDAVSADKLTALSNVYEKQLKSRKSNFEQQIDKLDNKNKTLEQTVSQLMSETRELNRELLNKELELVVLEDIAAENVKKRTVYNFVNVPIGSNVKTAEIAPNTLLLAEAGQAASVSRDIPIDNSELSLQSEFISSNDGGLEYIDSELSDEYINELFVELDQQYGDDPG